MSKKEFALRLGGAILAVVLGLAMSGHADAQVYNKFGPATGILKGNVNTYQTTAATASDVVNLFSGCTGTDYLGADFACHAAGGGGTPGGTSGQVQYNNSSTFGGMSNVTWTSSGSLIIAAPSFGVPFSVSGVNGTVLSNFVSGNGPTIGNPDVVISRSGSTINQIGEGPNLTLQDLGVATFSLLQQSGGQTELWQFNGGWHQAWYIATNDGMVVGAATGGSQGAGTLNATGLFVNGVAAGATPPGGTTGQIQYNNASAFGGMAFLYDTSVLPAIVSPSTVLLLASDPLASYPGTIGLFELSSGGSPTTGAGASFNLQAGNSVTTGNAGSIGLSGGGAGAGSNGNGGNVQIDAGAADGSGTNGAIVLGPGFNIISTGEWTFAGTPGTPGQVPTYNGPGVTPVWGTPGLVTANIVNNNGSATYTVPQGNFESVVFTGTNVSTLQITLQVPPDGSTVSIVSQASVATVTWVASGGIIPITFPTSLAAGVPFRAVSFGAGDWYPY